MITAFENYLRQQSDLNEKDIHQIVSLAVPRKLKRNELILSEGEICKHKVFIVSGMLRTTAITADGSEHILQFSPENNWSLDVESYDRQIPSRYNISAVEPSEILLWTKVNFERLRAGLPQLKLYAEQLISRNIHTGRQRLLLTLSATPEQKYEDFIQNFPELLSRLPLRMIAAYLGISLKTLTRIRHAQFQR